MPSRIHSIKQMFIKQMFIYLNKYLPFYVNKEYIQIDTSLTVEENCKNKIIPCFTIYQMHFFPCVNSWKLPVVHIATIMTWLPLPALMYRLGRSYLYCRVWVMCIVGTTSVGFNCYLQCLQVTKCCGTERHRNRTVRYNLILVKKILLIDGLSAISSFHTKWKPIALQEGPEI